MFCANLEHGMEFGSTSPCSGSGLRFATVGPHDRSRLASGKSVRPSEQMTVYFTDF